MPFNTDARSEDRAVALRAVRDLLVTTIEAADVVNVAALVKQLRETLAEIAVLPAEGVSSRVDDLAAARAVRLATAKDLRQAAVDQ